MYLFRKKDGSLEEAPQDFDPKEPDWSRMQEVQEVLFISKILVPQLKLVPKTMQGAEEKKSASTDSKGTKKDK